MKVKQTFCLMKIIMVTLVTFIFSIYATSAFSQNAKASINVTKQTTKEVLTKIEKQTDYLFVYNLDEINVGRKVSLNVVNEPVSKILDQLFKGTNITYLQSGNNISLIRKESEKVKSQQKSNLISGTIVDEAGVPIIGANVILKGTNKGDVTDMNGTFTLDAPKGSILLISFIGYNNKEVKVEDNRDLTIVLKENTKFLEEVVVVAFGTQKKSTLTSSVTSISSDKFAERPVVNTGQALQGMLPGLNLNMNSRAGGNINSTLSVNIRGKGTIGSESSDSPLVLIDGVEGDMNMINPNDIDNISVLKDASSASIYGSRAAFGVVLITTKKGKYGKCRINYSNNLQIDTPIILPDQLDSYTYVNYMNQAFINDGRDAFFSELQVERVKKYQEGTLIKEGATEFDPLWTIEPLSNGHYRIRDYWANTDWLNLMFKDKVFSHNHNLSVSGGENKVQYFISGNYMKKSGVAEFVDDALNRYTFMSRVNINCNKWLKLQAISRMSRTDFNTASAATGTYNIWTYIPVAPLHDPFGHYIHYENLLPIINGGRYKKQHDIYSNSLQLMLFPIKNLKITADATYKINTHFNHNDVQKVVAYNGFNEPYYVRNNGHAPGLSEVKEYGNKSNFFTTSILANYHNIFKVNHDINILCGVQYEHNKGRYLEALQDGIIIPSRPTINTTNGSNDKVMGGYSHWATAGLFSRINYSYKNKYLLELKLRYDGSSRFLDDKRWNLFPSISLGWNIANEEFMNETLDYLSELKVRFSYGTLGNQNTTDLYPFYQTLPLGSGNGNWLVNGEKTNTAGMPGLVSSSLGWEKVHDYNLGVDFTLFENRLSGSFDYYHRYTYDMVGPGVEMPNTLGTAVPVVNNADLVTRGFELELSWADKLDCDLGYGVRFILSDSQTEVLKYPNEQMNISTFYKGKKLGEIWGYQAIGIAKTQNEMDDHLANVVQNFNGGTKWQAGDLMYKDINGDGEVNGGKGLLSDMGDKQVIGNSTPRYNFGLTFNLDYKGFNLSAFFTGVMKRDYWCSGAALWGAQGSVWGSAPYTQCLDYFRPLETNDPLGPNPNGYLPGLTFTGKNRQINNLYLQNAAYVKFKNLSFGYNFPKKISNALKLDNLKMYLQIENLWTGTNMFKTIDPEMLNDTRRFYPLSRTYSFGVNVGF